MSENATINDIRKAMRAIGKDDYSTTILVPGWGQIKKVGNRYAVGPLPEFDDSDILTDYSAWTYCLKESWVLEDIENHLRVS